MVDIVNAFRKVDKPLTYKNIDIIAKECTTNELCQLTDYIISQFNCINYQALESYYADFGNLLIAVHSNTGSEYNIKEIVTSESDKVYNHLSQTVKKMTGYTDMTKVLALPDEDKKRIAWILSAETNATPRQISKFLHISFDKTQ